MKPRTLSLLLITLVICTVRVVAGGSEYTGKFDTDLIPNVEDEDRVIFKMDAGERLKGVGPFGATVHFAKGSLQDPQTHQNTILSYLVEEKGKDPVIFADANQDFLISADEKFELKRNADDTYLWNATIVLKVKEGMFKTCPLFVRYLKSYTLGDMSPDDRLMTQSTDVFARGRVSIKSKDVLVQYTYSFIDKKVDPQNGLLGMDIDGDGEIDMAYLSPEGTKADKETVVFRVGDLYLSTKKADISANQIVVREHEPKDYKRTELYLKKDFPDFAFTDFEGKKHRFSEFRGKYVLLDVWGFWCGPCRRELPYIREANRRFATRNLQVLGLNTDPDYTIDQMKKTLSDNQMTWPQAQLTSVSDFLGKNLRVNSFPTTFLISPEGKILSMSRTERDEPDLRGKYLLTTLDEILPKP